MNETSWTGARSPARTMAGDRQPAGQSANLADLLERILDKGIVIVGDIRVNLLDIELLTIKLRLLVASVDRAKEMGIDWWEHDPSLSSKARAGRPTEDGDHDLAEENRRLRERLTALEKALETGPPQEEATNQDKQRKTAQRKQTKDSGP
ncbi:hypothetical protein GCM10022254_12100 [Actinomadura meridiana]|uniref:Gas vesicle structural protein n=1 Tax=Actinomadura meridiana TaxID=559626 RepID=A0ABP8BV22_9ACTN